MIRQPQRAVEISACKLPAKGRSSAGRAAAMLLSPSLQATIPCPRRCCVKPCSAFGKASEMTPPATAQTVPATLQDANRVFLSHPSAAVPCIGICLCLAARLQHQTSFGVADWVVGAAVVALWLVQEWVVHKALLHSSFDWAGKRGLEQNIIACL